MKHLKEELFYAMRHASAAKPLFIILDSLDQMNSSNAGRQLSWFPSTIPAHVSIIMSTLEDAQYECFPKLKVYIIKYFTLPVS